jgi:diguanylate cyclase (GGDEF)-like protein
MKSLQDILKQRDLSALFQPVMDISTGTILGFEGLIRGPADGPLHSPASLFTAARQQGLILEVEMLCRQIVLESFAAQYLPGKIFLNVSPDVLTHPSFKNGQTLACLEKLDIDPKQVIIEITENQPTFDFDGMRNALLHYRSMGFQIAIDDLGEGFSSLRLWSELRPEFVKINMHFVQGVNSDPIKQQFLKSIQSIALSSGTQVIAEGIETAAEFKVIRDIGVDFGQGYFISRPSHIPSLDPSPEAGLLINLGRELRQTSHALTASCGVTAGKLLHYVEPASPETEHEKIFARFSGNTNLRAIPVVKNGTPVGLINRQQYIVCLVQPFRREILSRKPCNTCVEGIHCKDMSDKCIESEPLLVEKSTPIHELSHFLTESENAFFANDFIITEQGRYIGMGNAMHLLREITRMQIETARYANPLTLLPGNVPINEHIEHLLQSGKSFAVCYADLDNFKPFNDVCGYRKGDELIQFTARLLGTTCDPVHDFIGHIGGDDFILVMQSRDWEKRCHNALSAFANSSAALYDKDHRSIGGYLTGDRQGRIVHHSLPTLSIGAAWIIPESFSSHHEVAEAATLAKKMAKGKLGNSLFVERRRLHQNEMPEYIEAEVNYG